ncbi:hypothetical protein [Marinicella sp. W31]|uniref:hypothetical protein n=1 Tax=Marinicella sp. W31 TaxID=3023713 RepID=UPI0037575FAA
MQTLKLSLVLCLLLLSACRGNTQHTLKWRTASEYRNFGYDVYRSESLSGPFKRITQTPIPGAGTTDQISLYEYIDTSAKKRQRYYYFIESISEDGTRNQFTQPYPVIPEN